MSEETLDPCPMHEQEAQYRSDVENPSSSRRCSLLSDHLEAQKFGLSALKTYNSVGFGFHIGDMVWGKVKSHPWWPGHIYDETFASSSVRRTKREGHVLVAFFGDSSYGWFELAELVHFDSNFFEKSRQTNSKNFVKAVEEAVDEASRRAALGLICRCRNPYNFRPMNTPGYFAVNVLDYDVGIYSSSQIIQSRELFQPEKTLDFIKDLSLTAFCDSRSIECIKHKATFLIYRKIVFEEFDETYAQAFGIQPVRPSHELTCAMDPSAGASSRAPLSGPMVFAETVGGDDKAPAKSVKGKSSHKKDRYLFKRRDELTGPKKQTEEHSGDHISQKKDASTHRPPDSINSSPFLHYPSEEKASSVGIISPLRHSGSSSSVIFSSSDHVLPPPSTPENGDSPNVSTVPQLDDEGGGAQDLSSMAAAGGEEAKPGGMSTTPSKGCKHPSDGLSYMKETPAEKRKKSANKTEAETAQKEEKPDVMMTDEEALPESVGKSEFFHRENTDTDPSKQPLLYLKFLALDPFYGTEEDRQFVNRLILNFRSAVYQKSLVLSPPAEKDSADQNPLPPTAINEQTKAFPPSKPLKVPEFRSSDPTKSGRKRGCSSHNQEENNTSSKKAKKSNDSKQPAAERKAKQRRRDEGTREDPPPGSPSAGLRTKPAKKPAKADDPATLLIKFPGKTAIPSIGELKVKFARFGQLDPAGTRVFWNTNTCRVAFRHRADAEAAHKHTLESNSLFGNVAVRCQVKKEVSAVPAAGGEADSRHLHNHRGHHPPPLKLKSCLKKTTGQATMGARGVSRVKFIIDGREASAAGAEGEVECNRGKKYRSEKWIYNTSVVEKEVQKVDISIQMFTLLTRCSDIVTSLKKCLGYVPYRPL